MASKDFTSIDALVKFLNKEVDSVLLNEVADETVKAMQEHVETDVYSYESEYPRRMYDGGLIDPRKIEVKPHGKNVVSVENIAYDKNRNVPLIVETGVGYKYNNVGKRPFVANTKQELETGDRLSNAMSNGLKKRGIEIK